MAVTYKTVPKMNPFKKEEPPLFYAQAISSGEMSLRQLASQVSEISTVSSADTFAVIEAFLQVIPRALADGKIVRLGDLGSFTLQVGSEGTREEGSFNQKNITKVSVHFRPGKEFTRVTNLVEFVKIT